MVELFVRLGIALVFLGLGIAGVAPIDVSWKAAAALAGLSLFGWRLDLKGMMNSGVAGFFAVGEGMILALVLASAGFLQHLGFLILVPCVYAAIRFSSPMISMAPLAASGLVAAASFFAKNGIPAPQVLAHAIGVLGLSLLLGQRRPPVAAEEMAEEVQPERAPQLVEDGLLQVRESYRKLRDAYGDLERKSRKDKIVARIAKTQQAQGDTFYSELCTALRELTKADELAIYTLAHLEQAMVVRSVSQDFPGDLKDRSIAVDISKAPVALREEAEEALASLAIGAAVANVLLIHKGKVIGMVCAIDPNQKKLDEIRRHLTEAAPATARAIEAEMDREARIQRIKELELLYEVGSISAGATTPSILAARVARELRQSLRLGSVSISFVENGGEILIAQQGAQARLLDCMTFEEVQGVEGWLAAGTPEIVLFDARMDERCDPEETLKRRIGGFVLTPLWAGAEVVGYVSAATQVAGGIDLDQIAAIRLVASELSRAMERLVGANTGGMMTPSEFAAATQGREGSLIFLEPLRKEQVVSNYGFAAYEEAVRKLAHQVRAKLPAGSFLCRRDQGDFLVFLDTDEEFARNWANEVAASASFIAISTSDSAKRVPLALRAKVAPMTPQTNQLSAEYAA